MGNKDKTFDEDLNTKKCRVKFTGYTDINVTGIGDFAEEQVQTELKDVLRPILGEVGIEINDVRLKKK